MLPEELLKRVRQIEISTRKRVDDVMGGQFRSNFKGSGVVFSEHRQYVSGDDVRHIDWKVSARTRDPVIKKYEEERELTVLLIVDGSASAGFGSHAKLKSEVAAEIAGMLAYAASRAGDKVGVLIFDGKVEKLISPKKGRSHILRIIRDLLTFRAKTPGTDMKGAFESASRMLKHSGVIFILSDFIAEGYELPLKRLARKHDVIAMQIRDEREGLVPEIGQMIFLDPETGQERFIDTDSYAFKKWFKDFSTEDETDLEAALKGGRVERLKLRTKEDYAEAVVRFFRARARRRR